MLAILTPHPQPNEQALDAARLAPEGKNPTEVYSTISFLPGHAAASHFLILAGQATAGTQAACEYLLGSGPARDLPSAWRKPDGLPPTYEVLLKTAVRDFAPMRFEYVTHHAKDTK